MSHALNASARAGSSNSLAAAMASVLVPISVEEEESLQIAALEFLSDHGHLERVEKQCSIYRSSELVNTPLTHSLACSHVALY